MINFKENHNFQGSRGGGGPTFSRGGGSNCLFPIETHITCDFPGGSGPPVHPSGSAVDTFLCNCNVLDRLVSNSLEYILYL